MDVPSQMDDLCPSPLLWREWLFPRQLDLLGLSPQQQKSTHWTIHDFQAMAIASNVKDSDMDC
jgi:hypothetical protein